MIEVSDKQNKTLFNIYNKEDFAHYNHLDPNAKPINYINFIDDYKHEDSLNETKKIINLNNSIVLPYTKNQELFRICISGASGSGKTTLVGNLVTQILKEHKKTLVLYFSSLENDKYLDEVFKKVGNNNIIKYTHKSFYKLFNRRHNQNRQNQNNRGHHINKNMNKNLTKEQIYKNQLLKDINNNIFYNFDTMKEFINKHYKGYQPFIIFDDCESIPDNGNNKEIKNLIINLQKSILTAGRAHDHNEKSIHACFILHNLIATDPLVRTYLNECDYLAFNLQCTDSNTLDRLFKKRGMLQFSEHIKKLQKSGEKLLFMKIQFPLLIATNSFIRLI